MRSVYTNIRAARTAIKDVGRLRQIASVLVRHGLGHVVESWNLQDKFLLGLMVPQTPVGMKQKSLPARVTEATQQLGPTFVKLGQILSTRPDLIPQEFCDALATLQDQVLPIEAEAARKVIRDSTGRDVDDIFAEFDDEPLACASIAQVHTARLRTGEEVVVKVQRPGIRATIESDLHILYFAARQLEATIPEAQAFDPVSITREFEKAIIRELDFTYEADHLQRFDRNFEDDPGAHIPKLYREYSTSHVMVMERLKGCKITEGAQHGHDMEAVAKNAVRVLFTMVFEHGFFHGDLHPGNVFILEGGRMGLIDFGLVGRMTPTMKDMMADLLMAIVTSDYEGVARSFYEICIRRGPVNYGEFESDVIELMERYFSHKTLAEVDFGAFIRDLVEGAIRHNVTVPPDYTMFFKAIMTVEGIGKAIAPDLDLIGECQPYVEKLILARYSPERVMKSAADTLQAFARFGRQFPITAHQFLSQIEDGKLSIGVEHQQLEQLEKGRAERSNRAVTGAIAGVLMLCGTLVRHDPGFTLFGMPGLSAVLWIIGGGIASRVLWRIYRSGHW